MPDIKAVVQKMIDAGESEENIAKVIQHSKRVMVTPGDTVRARTEMNSQEEGGEFAPSNTIKGMVSMGQGMAHPQGILDLATLALPSDLGFGGGAKFIGEGASRAYQAAKAAGRETKGVGGVATLPMRTFQKFRDALPSSNAARAEEFLGPTRGAKPGPPTITENVGKDLFDRNYTSPKPPPTTRARLAGKAPTLEDALQEALTMETQDAPAASHAPTVGEVGGAQKPKVGKRPGGYTTDNPPSGPSDYQSASGPAATKPEAPPITEKAVQAAESMPESTAHSNGPESLAEETHNPSDVRADTGKAGKMADVQEGSDLLEQLMQRLHPEEEGIVHINPEGHGTMPAGEKSAADLVNESYQRERMKPENQARVKELQDSAHDLLDSYLKPEEPEGFWKTMRSTEPELDWHSGAEPGTKDAVSARRQHEYLGEMDKDYRRSLIDPRRD